MFDPLHDGLPDRLRQRLSEPLPGRAAQRQLTAELAYGRHFGPSAWNARQAAVLVVLYPHAGAWWIPLTQRPAHMVDHAGQISLPGGTSERSESPEQCAVREYSEELGADAASLQLVGRLTPLYVFASNFCVTPCVAMTDERPEFCPNNQEVARLIELPLARLWDPHGRSLHEIERRGVRFRTRDIVYGADRMWGATGMILSELAEASTPAQGEP